MALVVAVAVVALAVGGAFGAVAGFLYGRMVGEDSRDDTD